MGRVSATSPTLASPGRAARSASKPGLTERLVAALPPMILVVIVGLNGSAVQPAIWKWLASAAAAPEVPPTLALTCFASQLVGLVIKPWRSIDRAIWRRRSGIPSRIWGTGSLTTRRWASVGSTKTAARTTTVPRSKIPAWAGTTIESEIGAPL